MTNVGHLLAQMVSPVCQGLREDEDQSVASPMRQALDRLAQRAWTNRKGLPEPALDRNTSSPMLTPRTNPQDFLDPPSSVVIPSAANRQSASNHGSNRSNAMALNRRDGATGHRRDSATSKDMTGAQSSHTQSSHSHHTVTVRGHHTLIIHRHCTQASHSHHTVKVHSQQTQLSYTGNMQSLHTVTTLLPACYWLVTRLIPIHGQRFGLFPNTTLYKAKTIKACLSHPC